MAGLLKKPAVVLLVAGVVAGSGTPLPPAVAGDRGLTVVELFTSQGCSSCPPADALLGKLAGEEGVLALSFHVDYWDYIGWRDPFARKAFSKRQKHYARNFRKSFVYTPQMVVHGLSETTGSDEDSVRVLIEQVRTAPNVPIRLEHNKNEGLNITIAGSRHPAQAAVWIAVFDWRHKTAVKRGENRGRTIENFNVVRYLDKVGEWQGARLEMVIPATMLKKRPGDACAVFLQSEMKGPILGAATIALNTTR